MITTETFKIYLKKDEAGLLVYDDPVKQVFDEPLIGGTDTLLYSLGYKEGDELEFTGGDDQPDLPIVAELVGEDQDNPNSHFYRVVNSDVQFWLCPHLLDYFIKPPKYLGISPKAGSQFGD